MTSKLEKLEKQVKLLKKERQEVNRLLDKMVDAQKDGFWSTSFNISCVDLFKYRRSKMKKKS